MVNTGNWLPYSEPLVLTTAFVPKNVAIKMKLLLYRILTCNKQIDM